MKKISIVFLLFVLPSFLLAQTNVDKLVQTLDSLGLSSFDHWKVSPDLKLLQGMTGDPTQPGFDDSKWENLLLNQSIYPDTCWIRKEITLPRFNLGQPVSGKIKFLVTVDDYGYLWVNGESKGYFPWDGEFVLTDNAQPGQKFLIVIKACNTGGPLRLLRAEIQTENTSEMRSMIQDFSLSLKVGQKMLGFDTYQTSGGKKEDPGIDKAKAPREEKLKLSELLQKLATQVDVDALGSGNVEKFRTSLNNVRTQLKPIKDFVKRYTLFFDANAHIDAAWLWRDKETVEVCKNTFTSVLNMMDARPDFTYTQSAAAYFDWMERLYPDVFHRIQQRVKDGRWEIVGGMWVEPDCNLPSGESWMRHLLYAKRYFRNTLGADVKIGWNPDSFGYNGNMPEFYTDAGIDAFITQKIGWNEYNVFPYRLFWWQSADSSRVLSYFPFDYVNTVDNPFQLVDWLRQFDANTGFEKMMILFGVGDHGGGPSDEMIDRIERLKKLDIYPTIEYGTAKQYLDWVKNHDLSTLPVWNDELYLEYHQGTYTTQAKMKEWNRRSEVLLTNAEKLSSLASLFSKPYRGNDLEEAWRNVLFNQFHDILPGSGIRENYIDATEKFQKSKMIGTHELDQSMQTIARNVNTSKVKKGKPVIVMNTLSWNRTDVIHLALPEGDENSYSIFDLSGKELPSQIQIVDKYHRELLFTASDIPSMGYRTYALVTKPSSKKSTNLNSSLTGIENQLLRVTIDTSTGWVSSIFDKRNGKELLSGAGNELQILEDKPKAWDAWNVGLTGVKFPSRLRKIEFVENGPVRATIRITRDYLKPGVQKDPPTPTYPSSFFTQEITLYDDDDQVHFALDADWWEEKTMIKVAFPLSFTDSVATYEIPYGTIRRSTRVDDRWEKAKVEVPAQRWADVSTGDYGVSLLNTSKYGYDIKGNVMRLSMLRSPVWPDPTADRGKHSIEYAIYPHQQTWKQAQTIHRGYELNNPLIAVISDAHQGSLPEEKSFIRLEPKNLVLTTVKKAEDSGAWIIQWYETDGKDVDAVLTLPNQPKKVLTTNVMEEDGTTVSYTGKSVNVPTKKYSTKTVKVYFGK